MTSVEDALSLTREGSTLLTAATPRAFRAETAAVQPRASVPLEHRRQWERTHRVRLALTDAAVITTVIAVACGIQLPLGEPLTGVALHGGLLAAVWFIALWTIRSYDAALSPTSTDEYRSVAHASGIAIGAMAIVALLLEWESMRLTVLIALPAGLLGLLVSRVSWRRWLSSRRRQGQFTSRTLIVGNREDVEYAARILHPIGTAGYEVVGVTLLDGNARELQVENTTIPVLGNFTSIAQVASEVQADTVFVASRPEGNPDFVKKLSWQLEGTAAELVLANRLADVVGQRLSLEPVDGMPLIRVQIATHTGSRHLFKRAIDIVTSALALIPIALATPVLALLIKLDSPGPVFFFQERVGRDGRRFRMIKFRSMSTGAEHQLGALKEKNDGAGPLFKLKDDPRVTRVGRVLRKLSLDELPQFWNVLAGEMSVVGPRPPLPHETMSYDSTVSRRLYIKPGITGLWQVSGRSDLSWEESIRLDLRYVENWSVVNDLKIMWRTASVMFAPKGAY
ncbi:polyprenyl glycosylphosphotransferase [Microbacterium sp. CH12i]|uniref:sugar transferase n=1 Tax=Microbacterium sp. CH12i TaxID=1479651 RepID=UPI000460C343|nr:sugar transferase [Microbacterium sp. CH12i]KDA04880.1 polyprenyl glycosylphosphotransferase [Microbacterium sp. CH12i]